MPKLEVYKRNTNSVKCTGLLICEEGNLKKKIIFKCLNTWMPREQGLGAGSGGRNADYSIMKCEGTSG